MGTGLRKRDVTTERALNMQRRMRHLRCMNDLFQLWNK